jgi:cobalt-zinc-cadmium efflux system protein
LPHDHSHHGHHHHAHGTHPADFGTAFAAGIALNLGFVAVETGYGFAANSMALLADAGHNLADVLGLATAWAAAILSKRPPTRRFSYGLRASSILAALANSVILLIAVGFIAYHAVVRLIIPDFVAGGTVTAVAAIGIAINAATAFSTSAAPISTWSPTLSSRPAWSRPGSRSRRPAGSGSTRSRA